MAHFVQHLSNEGVVHALFTELSTAYTANLKSKDKDAPNEHKVYQEVNEWLMQHEKLLMAKNYNGLFEHCFNSRLNLFDTTHSDGTQFTISIANFNRISKTIPWYHLPPQLLFP